MSNTTVITVCLILCAFSLGMAFTFAFMRNQVKVLDTALGLKIEELDDLEWRLEQEESKAAQYRKALIFIRDSNSGPSYVGTAQMREKAKTALDWTPQ